MVHHNKYQRFAVGIALTQKAIQGVQQQGFVAGGNYHHHIGIYRRELHRHQGRNPESAKIGIGKTHCRAYFLLFR